LIISGVGTGISLIEEIFDRAKENPFRFTGEAAYSMYAVEQGIPRAPYEINEDYNPHEINLAGDVSFTKGCYIGQEVIARLDTYDKVQKRLMGIIYSKEVNTSSLITSSPSAFKKSPDNQIDNSLVESKIPAYAEAKLRLRAGRTNPKSKIITPSGDMIGTAGSLTYSLSLNRWIGLAFLRKNFQKPGDTITIRNEDSAPVQAKIVELPFLP
jgi:folate-binding protein YgfZ